MKVTVSQSRKTENGLGVGEDVRQWPMLWNAVGRNILIKTIMALITHSEIKPENMDIIYNKGSIMISSGLLN